VRRQQPLIGDDQFDIPQTRAVGVADIRIIDSAGAGGSIGIVTAIDIGNQGAEIPVGIGAIVDAQIEVTIDGLMLDFLIATRVIDAGDLRTALVPLRS
jgi:hypothetical protein